MPGWVLSPVRGTAGDRERSEQFRDALRTALELAHGAGAEFELTLSSGPAPSWVVRAIDGSAARVFQRAVAGAYGEGRWTSVGEESGTPDLSGTWEARRAQPWPEPLGTTPSGISVADAWTGAMRLLPRGGRLRARFRPVRSEPYVGRASAVRPLELAPGPGRRGPPAPRRRPDGEGTAPPLDAPTFWKARIELLPGDPPAARLPAPRLAALLGAASRSARGNRVRFRPGARWLRLRSAGFELSTAELQGFWPSGEGAGTSKDGLVPMGQRLGLGRSADGRVVGPTIEPTQGRHLAILGETGMGKSSLLVAVAGQAFRSAGAIVLDPMGETAADLRGELSPSMERRLAWVAAGSVAPAINALEGIHSGVGTDPIRTERRLTDLVHALRRVRSGRFTDSSYWGPRLEEMLTRAVRAAASLPRGTLVDAHTLLATGGRSTRPVPDSATEPLAELARRIRDRPEDADGARRLLYEVVRNPVLRAMLCAESPTESVADLVRNGRVVIVSGDAAKVGEATARYLLSVYLAVLWSELLARPGNEKTYVLLDEAQWFSHESLGEMLRLGRRRNVHVVVATQAIGSLAEPLPETVWTNVSDFVAFRGSPTEAREMGRIAPSVSAASLLALRRGEAVALLGKGHEIAWIRTARRPPRATEAIGSEDPGVDSPVLPPSGSGETALADEAVWSELEMRAESSPGEARVLVPLAALHRVAVGDPIAVRRVGTQLARSGALRRLRLAEGGAGWSVDPRAIPRPHRGTRPAGRTEPSPAPQPS